MRSEPCEKCNYYRPAEYPCKCGKFMKRTDAMKCKCKVYEDDYGDIGDTCWEVRQCPLCKSAPTLLAMLERLEWVEEDGAKGRDTHTRCLVCKLTKYHGHRPECELAALLIVARGEV